jgi:hypothetical protein
MDDLTNCDGTIVGRARLARLSMRKHVPQLDQQLRARDVTAVRADYCGRYSQGGFDRLLFFRSDGTDGLTVDGICNLQLKAVFRALLLAREPGWCRGAGSCGDFRWDLRSDALIHHHYLLGKPHEWTPDHRVAGTRPIRGTIPHIQ